MGYSFKYFTKPGKNKEQNEDCLAIYELSDGLLIALCDGISGSPISFMASKLCVESVKDYFIQSDEPNIINKIKKSIESANELIQNYTDDESNITTTADVLFLNSNFAYWGHIGDSRIYHFKNDSLHRITKDHSVVQKLVDEGFLTMREADLQPIKNMIYSALGERKEIQMDLSKLYLNNTDEHYFLLCTDGVTSILSDDEIKESLKLSTLDLISDSIEQKLIEREPEDDYSLIVVKSERNIKTNKV